MKDQAQLFQGTDIDESLLQRRKVLTCEDDVQGLGFDVHLACGHWVWLAVRANQTEYCGACLDQLVKQVRNARDRQQSSLREG